jgi:aspartate ammonia-lyase
MIQGGAGTSTNMNANEVIANIGLLQMGYAKGEYAHLHPNNDVNMSQSTNDAYPTAVRLSILLKHGDLVKALAALRDAFAAKGDEFGGIIKMGRTQLQDAVPMTLGQEFKSFASTLSEDVQRIDELSELLKEINLGGTAIGTGINTDPEYAQLAVGYLSELSGFEFKRASDLVEASSDMGAFVLFSSMLKRLAVKLSKIANDLRMLSMGPRCGLNEINLPAQQPGSSIMPGKINPVIPEAVNQVAYQVIGNDLAVTMAAEAGQLQLNAMEPLIAYNVLESIRMLTQAMGMLENRCVRGITANVDRCQALVDQSIGIITAVVPYIGYDNSTRIAKKALKTGRGVLELIREEKLMTDEALEDVLKPDNMIRPQPRRSAER